MELCSLHPFDEPRALALIAAIAGERGPGERSSWEAATIERARAAVARVRGGQARAINEVSFAFARLLATAEPSFVHGGLSLTGWEARIDRGLGMLMRPPSRLLIEGGLDPAVARQAPIRLELSAGMMGGAYIPARLVPEARRLLDAKLERTVRRLVEGEFDAIPMMALMIEATDYAASRGLGLYEAMDVVDPAGGSDVPGARIVLADTKRLDRALRSRLVEASKPPKKPGLMARLFGRHGAAGNPAE